MKREAAAHCEERFFLGLKEYLPDINFTFKKDTDVLVRTVLHSYSIQVVRVPLDCGSPQVSLLTDGLKKLK